eukprot:GHUV01049897.1.p1 GENE.GHUV01049897.1~~GHUV01049897.1.p1  ORF type:complete len:108 (+),score=23.31 GHUV01049897.1:633-956(+)
MSEQGHRFKQGLTGSATGSSMLSAGLCYVAHFLVSFPGQPQQNVPQAHWRRRTLFALRTAEPKATSRYLLWRLRLCVLLAGHCCCGKFDQREPQRIQPQPCSLSCQG